MSTRKGTRKGKAGSGVGDASREFGANAAVGSLGERQFADILDRAGLTGDGGYDAWYSVKVPNKDGSKGKTDVDLVLSSGNRVVLIDVKRWASSTWKTSSSGKKVKAPVTYWSIPFLNLPMKGLSPLKNGNGEWRLSRSMEMATDRFAPLFGNARVLSIVVFVPTTKDGRGPANVSFLRWPGNIKSYSAQDSLRVIQKFLGAPKSTSSKIASTLSRMVYQK